MSKQIEIKERPILFSGDMVRAIIYGKKTQTRRIVKPQPPHFAWTRVKEYAAGMTEVQPGYWMRCPYGCVGDRLWVRETFKANGTMGGPRITYKADTSERYFGNAPSGSALWIADDDTWRPSIHMPRWASRINLEITNIRVERLQHISEEDAKAEGILSFTKDNQLFKYWPCDPFSFYLGDGPLKCAWADLPKSAKQAFSMLWKCIYGENAWDANPWVWVIEFRRIT